MAEQTVREQLAAAITELLEHPTLGHYAINNMPPADYHDFMARYESVKTALDRHRAEPECDAHTVPCEKCRGTGARHVAGEPTQEPCGECSGEGVIPRLKEHCACDGPDSLNCPTWERGYQAGLEAQRERVGGGKA